MEIRHLKLIKAVAEYKSLTRAANKLFLTQSALSHQVKEIEDEFNTRLFLRINKQMILTPAGERLLKTADTVLLEIQKNVDDIKRITSKDSGVIRISTQCYTCYHWLSSFLRKFHIKYPNVEIRIIAEATRKPLEFLEEGKLDLAIINSPLENPHFNYQRLFDDEMVAIFAKEHSWAKSKFISANDFADQTYLMYATNIEESQSFKHLFDGSGILPANIIKIQLTEAIIEMAKANMGVAVLAKWAVAPYLTSNELLARPVGEKGYLRTWHAATLAVSDIPDYLKEFINSLGKHSMEVLNLK